MKNQGGFSLIELMIVVAILGLVATIAIPSISNTFRFSVKSAGRELATLIKDASNAAQITGKIHRIAYDLKTEQYWVESTSEEVLLSNADSKEKEESQSRFAKSDDEEEKSPFRQERILTRKKRTLPIGVRFTDIISEQSDAVITEGIAYTHIFPHGMTEKTIIHLEDTAKNQVSLVVSNLLGRCTLEGRYLEAEEAFAL